MSEHNKTGLITKYVIFKTRGEGKPDKRLRSMVSAFRNEIRYTPLWYKRTWSFVLSPEKDDAYGKASRQALMTYARVIRETNPRLADDIVRRIDAPDWEIS